MPDASTQTDVLTGAHDAWSTMFREKILPMAEEATRLRTNLHNMAEEATRLRIAVHNMEVIRRDMEVVWEQQEREMRGQYGVMRDLAHTWEMRFRRTTRRPHD